MPSSLTLRRLRARATVLPLQRPIVARIATISDWPVILIDLETEEGIVGRSYLEPYTIRTMRYLVQALEDLGEVLRGQPVAPQPLHAAAGKSLHFVGYAGLSMIAVSGLDMAAWDALAQARGVPLCVLLGGVPGAVPAYNSNGLWLAEPAALADEALALVAEGGFRGLKMRMGRARVEDDLAALEAVSAAIGPDVALMVDFNQGLDYAEAQRRCRLLDDAGLAWIEEPVVYDDLQSCRKLARDLKTPLMLGENFYGPRELALALQLEACDLVMPDFMRIGGVTGWQRAAAIAAAAGVPISTHLYPEVAAQVMRVTPTAHWLEWQNWVDPLLQEPYALIDGALQVPDRPGLGLTWNEEAVAAYAAGR